MSLFDFFGQGDDDQSQDNGVGSSLSMLGLGQTPDSGGSAFDTGQGGSGQSFNPGGYGTGMSQLGYGGYGNTGGAGHNQGQSGYGTTLDSIQSGVTVVPDPFLRSLFPNSWPATANPGTPSLGGILNLQPYSPPKPLMPGDPGYDPDPGFNENRLYDPSGSSPAIDPGFDRYTWDGIDDTAPDQPSPVTWQAPSVWKSSGAGSLFDLSPSNVGLVDPGPSPGAISSDAWWKNPDYAAQGYETPSGNSAGGAGDHPTGDLTDVSGNGAAPSTTANQPVGPAKASDYIDPITGKLDYTRWLADGVSRIGNGNGGTFLEDDIPDLIERTGNQNLQTVVDAVADPANAGPVNLTDLMANRAPGGDPDSLAQQVVMQGNQGSGDSGDAPGATDPNAYDYPKVGEPPDTPEGRQIRALIEKYCKMYNVPVQLMFNKAYVETGGTWDPNSYNKNSGASGLFQIMPATAKGLGIDDPFDLEKNIEGATKLMANLLHQTNGDPFLAEIGYNSRPKNIKSNGPLPVETYYHLQKVFPGWRLDYLKKRSPFR